MQIALGGWLQCHLSETHYRQERTDRCDLNLVSHRRHTSSSPLVRGATVRSVSFPQFFPRVIFFTVEATHN